jgi:hypothetical protein
VLDGERVTNRSNSRDCVLIVAVGTQSLSPIRRSRSASVEVRLLRVSVK